MKASRYPFYLLIFFFSTYVHAQQFSGFPPSFRWQQINTDTARIIFTKGAEWKAERIASLIHRAAADTPFAIGSRLRKINIVLHNHTTLANGYVGYAPFRSEYYLVPSSNVFEFGNLPWYENLALHEYRHVQQYNNFRNGLSNGFYYLFGEQGMAFANAITVPDWFFEGDAVHAETALSEQGRGRLNNFLSGYNSLWLYRKNYSWMKLRNGSLKDYVPDHYQLGYLLTNYGYLRYGPDFWQKVTHDGIAFKGLFYPFQAAVKKYSGLDYKTFRKEALGFYKQKLEGASEKDSAATKNVTRYFFPQYVGIDSLLYLKTAYNKLPAFFLRTNGKENKLELQSISSEEWFSYRDQKLVYTAYSTNARWSLIDYSDIILFDLNSHSEKRLTHQKKYYTPDLSPSADRIAAICINDSLQTELHVMDASTGKLLQQVKPGPGIYLTQPRFVDKDKIVVGTRTPDSRMALQLYHLSSGTWEQLTPFTNHTMGFPFVSSDTIYFTANFQANDDIYFMSLNNRKIFQLTHGFTGNYYPSVFRNELVWSHFTANGYALAKKDLDNMKAAEINTAALQDTSLLFPVALKYDIENIGTRNFKVSLYRSSTGLFHFHSWTPNYQDPEFSFTLYSDNILNTFSNQLYYVYNQNETSHTVGWNTAYGALFPILNAGAAYTFNRTINTVTNQLQVDQFKADLGYNIPLNFSRGKTYKFLNFGSSLVFSNTRPSGFSKDSMFTQNATYLSHVLSWSHYLPMAVQHIYPKLGYAAAVRYENLLSRKGYQFLANAQVFLPSIANHSIVITGSFQQTDTTTFHNTGMVDILFSNRFANSRGYDDYYLSRMWKVGGNYHFPIAYPDFGIASIVYFQRLRGNVFYDYTRVYSNDKSLYRNMKSVGGELFFDTKWWNQQPVSFGFRISHLLDNGFSANDRKGNNWFEFILPVSLIY